MSAHSLLLMRHKISAAHAVFARHSLLGRSQETIEKVASAGVPEPAFLQRFDHLCNLQSAGNSPGPEVNVVARLFGQFGTDDDVGELEPSARLHHPAEFIEDRLLVRSEIDHAV